MTQRILLLDNYDSFTYNLYQLLSCIGTDVTVRRNDELSVDEALAARPDAIGAALEQLLCRGRVVANDVRLGPELPDVLNEVVGERVVVVDQEDPGGPRPAGSARAPARLLVAHDHR